MTPKELAARHAVQLSYLTPQAKKLGVKVELDERNGFQVITALGGRLHFDYYTQVQVYLSKEMARIAPKV